MSRGLIVVLAASLAVNVFLGGFVAGRFFGGPPHHRMVMQGPLDHGGAMFRDTKVLSDEGRDAFHAVFKARRAELRPSFQEMRRLREALSAALAAEPWDRARAEKALADLRAVEDRHEATFSATLIDAFEKLSPADRKALIEAAHARRDEWRDRRKRWRKERGADGPPPEDGPPADGPAPDEAPPPED